MEPSAATTTGLEFTISARGSVAYDSSLRTVEKKVLDAVTKAVQYINTNY